MQFSTYIYIFRLG